MSKNTICITIHVLLTWGGSVATEEEEESKFQRDL